MIWATLDLTPGTLTQQLKHVQASPLWDVIKPIGDFVADAGEAQTKALLAALVARVGCDFATGRIKIEDKDAFANLGALLGVAGAVVGKEIGLDTRPETKVPEVIPNTSDRNYILAEDQDGDGPVHITLVGWRVQPDGIVTPIPAGKPPGRWATVNGVHCTGVWSDGTVANLGDIEAKLGKHPGVSHD